MAAEIRDGDEMQSVRTGSSVESGQQSVLWVRIIFSTIIDYSFQPEKLLFSA